MSSRQEIQDTIDREPHLEGQGRLRDGLQVLQEPEHQSSPGPSPVIEGHEDELRHRLEQVAQAPSESTDTESEAPSSTTGNTKSSSATALGVPHVNVADPSRLSPISPKSKGADRVPSPQPHPYSPVPLKFHTPSYTQDANASVSSSPEDKTVPPTPPGHHHLSHLIHLSREPSHLKGLAHLLDHDRYSPDRSQAASGQATPTPEAHHHSHNVIRPLVKAIMAFEKGRKFSTGTSVHRKRKMSTLVEKEGAFGPALTVCKLPSLVHLSTFSSCE